MERVDGSGGDAPLALKREFTLWSATALAFAFISPIVALYAIFAFAFGAAGPSAWWGFLIVLGGQLLIALVFAELASRWPFEGSVYQWTRRLRSHTFGWFAGWAYMWTLMIAAATVCYGAAGFIPAVLDIEPFSKGEQLAAAIGVLAFVSFINTVGRGAMKVMIALSITAELVGSIGIGTALLLFHREHGLGDLFESAGASYGAGPFAWAGTAAAVAFIGWAFVGFESAGAISEEVKEPARDVPKAILVSLVVVAAVVIYSALALILAIPDFGAVISGDVADPVADTIAAQIGSGISRPLFALFIVGFLASALALQASASRVMWAFARDDVLPASGLLKRLSGADRMPVVAIVTAGAISALVLVSTQSDDVYQTLVNFTTGGFYMAFCFPVLAALALRLRRGGFSPGPFSLGRLGLPITVAASIWVVFELVNIAWPRADGVPWYQDWGVIVMIVVVGALGVVAYLPHRRRILAAAE